MSPAGAAPADAAPDLAAVQLAHAARWARLDPAVAAPGELPREGLLAARRPDGSVALGAGAVSRVDPAEAGAAFRAIVEHTLRARVAGPDVRGVLGDLLDRWVDGVESAHRPGRDAEGRRDPVLSLSWPSRDVEATAALLDRGFRARAMLALRSSGSHPPNAVDTGPDDAGVLVRPAGPADADAVLDAQLAEMAYDELAGSLRVRAGTRAAMAPEIAGAVRRGAVLVAEREGEVVGVVGIEPPARSQAMTATLAGADVSYLVVLHVRPELRGRGIGGALARAAIVSAPGAVALHYAALNPLSVPFWSRHGFRPVLTHWLRSVGGSS